MPIIYRIFNIDTQESYIGQTYTPLEERFSKHKAKAFRRKASTKFARALRDLGLISFSTEILEEINSLDFNSPQELQDCLDQKELFWISKYNAIEKGYNTNNYCQGYRNPSRNRDSKIEYEELKRLFLEENQTREDIRKKINISKGHFHRLVKAWNLEKTHDIIGKSSAITKMKKNLSSNKIEQLKSLYSNNSTIKEISKKLNISRASVYRYIKFLNLKRSKNVTIT